MRNVQRFQVLNPNLLFHVDHKEVVYRVKHKSVGGALQNFHAVREIISVTQSSEFT